MQTVNIHEAKTRFSKLVESAANGAEIVIARAGQPTARLMPLAEKKVTRTFGVLRGKIELADDFDTQLPEEILAAFEGS